MNKMIKLIVSISLFFLPLVVSAGTSLNTGRVLEVSKGLRGEAEACCFTVQGANLSNSCPTADNYDLVCFTCKHTGGSQAFSMALTAYAMGKSVKIMSNACSQYGISAANLVEITLVQ